MIDMMIYCPSQLQVGQFNVQISSHTDSMPVAVRPFKLPFAERMHRNVVGLVKEVEKMSV